MSVLEYDEVVRGATAFVEGEFGDSLAIVESGKVKVARRGPPGHEQILYVRGPCDVFGELSLLEPGPRTATATALTDTRLAWLSREAFQCWLAEHPSGGEQLLRVLARRLRRTNEALADLVCRDVPGRLAKALLGFAEQFGEADGDVVHVPHGLRQDELAQLVGTSRETVNKALADFAGRGWIVVASRSVTILDADRLHNRAC